MMYKTLCPEGHEKVFRQYVPRTTTCSICQKKFTVDQVTPIENNYIIESTGNIYHHAKKLNGCIRGGRRHVFLRNKWTPVAELVLSAFGPERSQGEEIEHIDGNNLNDSIENLCWRKFTRPVSYSSFYKTKCSKGHTKIFKQYVPKTFTCRVCAKKFTVQELFISSWAEYHKQETVHGDTSEKKIIKDGYVVSSAGNLYHRGKRVPQIGNESTDIAELVLEAFVPVRPRNGKIEHIDDDLSNNALENLRWISSTNESEPKRFIKTFRQYSICEHCGKKVFNKTTGDLFKCPWCLKTIKNQKLEEEGEYPPPHTWCSHCHSVFLTNNVDEWVVCPHCKQSTINSKLPREVSCNIASQSQN